MTLAGALHARAAATGVAVLLALPAAGAIGVAPVIAWAILLAAVLTVLARLTDLRARVARERSTEPAERDPGAEVTPPADAAPPALAPPARVRLQHFARLGVGSMLGGAGLTALLLCARFLARAGAPPPPGSATIVAAVTLAAAGVILFAAARWSAIVDVAALPEARALSAWLHGARWIAWLTAAAMLARGIGLPMFDVDRWLAAALLLPSAAAAVEILARGVARLATPRDRIVAVAPIASLTLDVLLHPRGPVSGAAEVAERELGLSLRSTWALGFALERLPALGAGLAVLLWLTTTLVVVGPDEQGVRLRFGRLVSPDPVEAGPHVTWPWPIEVVERYPVRKAQTLALGSTGPRAQSLLWARTHASEEYTLLLGDGRELVSVDAVIVYRIRDVVRYALASQNAPDALETLAYRLLMHVTVTSSLDRLLAVDRGRFARQFAERLQREVDTAGLGLDVLHAGFTSLHPPVAVAAEYQAVVSAEVARRTVVARALEERERILPAVASEAEAEVMSAQAAGALRVAEATGSASAFAAALAQHRVAPGLFTFRRRLETLEEGASGLGLYVVDRRVGVEAGELWIDLRSGAAEGVR
jgi:regulator of protease activity HflC (stomatin/prohibitin superfamily)